MNAEKKGTKPPRPPLALILVLCLLMAVEVLVRQGSDYLLSFTEKVMRGKKAWIAQPQEQPIDWLIVGDSRAMGLDARVLSDGLSSSGHEIKVYNLSLPNHGVQSYALLLKLYLKHHSPPERIVLSIAPVTLMAEWFNADPDASASTELHRFCRMYSFGEGLSAFDRSMWLKLALAKLERLSYTLTYRKQLIDVWRDKGPVSRLSQQQVNTMLKRYNGGVQMGVGPAPDAPTIRGSAIYKHSFAVNEQAVEAYLKFLQLAADHNIQVTVVHAPMVQAVYDKRMDDGSYQRYVDVIHRIRQQHPQVEWIEPLWTAWEARYFNDPQHLNSDGDNRWTRELVELLRLL